MSRDDDVSKRSLRERAEGAVKSHGARTDLMTPEAMRGIIHELQVHQIELEMQNEELRRAQHDLEVSRDRFFWLFNHAPVGYLTLDESGIVHQANQTLADMLGVGVIEIQGKPFIRWMDPRDADIFLARFRAIFRQPEAKWLEVALLTRPRRRLYASLEGRQLEFPLPLREERSGKRLLLLAVRDVTERRRAQEALVASERLLKVILESTADGILCVDAEGRAMQSNVTFAEMWRLPREEVDGVLDRALFSSVADQLDDPLGFLRAVQEQARSGEEQSGSLSFLDGRILEWYGRPLAQDQRVAGSLWSFRDVTAMRRLEAQYRQAQKMEAVGQLAGGVAHDFNNLLQVITGYVELALMELAEDHGARPRLERVRGAAARATALVRQLLAFSRRQSMRMQRVDVNEVIGNVLGMLRRVLGEHIEIVFRADAAVGPIHGDPGQIELVLMNLAVNSRDAMPEGGRITIDTQRVVVGPDFRRENEWATAAEYVLMSVSDTGTGISEELREHIFEPFFTTKGIGKGTGLGLATAYGIIKQHDGAIVLGRGDGPGAVFHVYLPVMSGERGSESGASMKTCHGAPPGAGGPLSVGTILVAEDDELVREMAVQILESAGYRTIVARDGQEARQKFREHADQVDLAFLDVVMPNGSGRAVGDYIHSLNPRIPVLLCTGYDFSILGEAATRTAPFDVIRKPYDRDRLLRCIRDILECRAVDFDAEV